MNSKMLEKNDPLMLAWEAHKTTQEYKNSRYWVKHENYAEGSLWALFLAGWAAAQAFLQDQQPCAINLQHDQTEAPTGKPQINARAALAEPAADEPVARACQYNGGTCNRRSCAHECAAMTLCDPHPAPAPAEIGEYPPLPEAVAVARAFHEAYERLAPQFGYSTRQETRQFDPESPNGKLMQAVCHEVMRAYVDADRAQRVPLTEAEIERCRQEGYAHSGLRATFDFCKAARAIERAHGIGAKP